jgi:hypothetical protein
MENTNYSIYNNISSGYAAIMSSCNFRNLITPGTELGELYEIEKQPSKTSNNRRRIPPS